MRIKKVPQPDLSLPTDSKLLKILVGIAKDQEQFDDCFEEVEADLLGCIERFVRRLMGMLICKEGKDWYLFDGDRFIECPLWCVVWAIEHILSEGLKREASLLWGGKKALKHFGKKIGVEEDELSKLSIEKSFVLLDKRLTERIKSSLTDKDALGDLIKLQEEFARLRERGEKSSLRKSTASRCREGSLLNGLLKHLPFAQGIYRRIEELDSDGYLLVCKGGITLDLRYIKEPERMPRKSTQYDLNTLCCNAYYDPQSINPVFEKQFNHVIDDEEARETHHMVFGSAVDGTRNKEIMDIIVGSPGSGKTMLVNAIANPLGDYATRVAGNFFLVNKSRGKGDATPHLVQIIGKRLVIASEPDGNDPLDEGLIKTLTGEPDLNYRAMYDGKERLMHPVCTMIMTTNKLPRLSGNDAAITSRRLIIHRKRGSLSLDQMKNTVDFTRELEAENSGILNFLLEGYRKSTSYARIPIPESIQRELADYQYEYDETSRFFAENSVQADMFSTKDGATVDELFSRYSKWSEDQHNKYTLSKSAFGSKLKSKGYVQKVVRDNNKPVRRWLGIHLPTPGSKPASNGHESNGHRLDDMPAYTVADTSDLNEGSF